MLDQKNRGMGACDNFRDKASMSKGGREEAGELHAGPKTTELGTCYNFCHKATLLQGKTVVACGVVVILKIVALSLLQR